MTCYSCFSQDTDTIKLQIPSIDIRTLEGKIFNTSDISNQGNPIILCFWKTCCKPPVKMLDAIAEVYEDWQDETGVKLFAVSIDDSRNSSKVGPFVNGRRWDYEILLDPNSDFKRAMNVNVVPHTFILNSNREIVWQKVLFNEGDEEEIYEIIDEYFFK